MVSPCVIDYRETFRLAVPPETVWSAIEHVDRFEQWWGWLREFTLEGDALAPGSVLQGVVTPPLPYRMRLRVVVIDSVRPTSIDAAVHGDLEGTAHLRLEPDGDGTQAVVAWRIEMMQRPMRAAATVAHPLLRWGHDRVVAATVAGFRRQIEQASST